MTIINRIEKDIAELVYHTSYFTEMYSRYTQEANKSSKDYSHTRATYLFEKSVHYAKYAISIAQEMGLNPEVVCRDCVIFMDSYKVAA